MTNERDQRPFFVVADTADTGPEDGIPPEELQTLGAELLQAVPRHFRGEPEVEAHSRTGATFALSYLSGRVQDSSAYWTRFAAVKNRVDTPDGPRLVLATYFMDEVGITAQPSVHRCVVSGANDDGILIASYTFGQTAHRPDALAEANEWLERDQEEILLPNTMTPEERLRLPPLDGASHIRWSVQRASSILQAHSIAKHIPNPPRRPWRRT